MTKKLEQTMIDFFVKKKKEKSKDNMEITINKLKEILHTMEERDAGRRIQGVQEVIH